MTFALFFSILCARWKVLLGVLALAIAGTGMVNSLLPKSYTASVAVLVDVKSPDPIAGIVFPGMNSPSYMATQVDVIQSDRVSQQVVSTMRMEESPVMRAHWRDSTQGAGSFSSWLGDALRKNLEVKPSRDSNVITVAYKSPDPKFAAAMANAYAKAYIDVSLELRVEPARNYGRFFDQRAKQLREGVEQARAKLTALQRAKGIVGADERLDVENARLNELSSQLVGLQALSAETSSRQAQGQGAADRLQDNLSSALIGNLRIDLSREESRLKELRERLGDSHPTIVEMKANVAELRNRIDAETARAGAGVGISNAINGQRLRQVQAALEAQRVKVLRLKEARDEIAVLAADVDAAQRAYESVNVRANQAELEGRTTQTNLYVLNPASEPTLPSSPRVSLNMLMALFVGTLFGIGAAMLTELFDRRVRSTAEVVQALEIPLLGVLARKPGGRLFGRGKVPALAPGHEAGSPPPLATRAEPLLEPMALFAAPGHAMTRLTATHADATDATLTTTATTATTAKDAAAPPGSTPLAATVQDRVLGEIFKETRQLEARQIEAILAHQRAHGMLFGESAVALKLVDESDVKWALSQQFHYPYALAGRKQLNPELISATTPFSSLAETFRSIRSQLIRRFDQDGERRALAVVSADPSDGKTFLAANLAIAFSQLGRRTLLIDADMRSPRLHRVFGVDNSRGLSSILSGRLTTRVLAPVTDLPSLFVLPVGVAPPNPLELLESPAFGILIRELTDKFDHVIVDSPSAIFGADAGVVAARCGAFLAVARQGRTRMDAMLELVRSLRDTTTHPLGFVMNEH